MRFRSCLRTSASSRRTYHRYLLTEESIGLHVWCGGRGDPIVRCRTGVRRAVNGRQLTDEAARSIRLADQEFRFFATPRARVKPGGIRMSSGVRSWTEALPSPIRAESMPPRRISSTFSTPA